MMSLRKMSTYQLERDSCCGKEDCGKGTGACIEVGALGVGESDTRVRTLGIYGGAEEVAFPAQAGNQNLRSPPRTPDIPMQAGWQGLDTARGRRAETWGDQRGVPERM